MMQSYHVMSGGIANDLRAQCRYNGSSTPSSPYAAMINNVGIDAGVQRSRHTASQPGSSKGLQRICVGIRFSAAASAIAAACVFSEFIVETGFNLL